MPDKKRPEDVEAGRRLREAREALRYAPKEFYTQLKVSKQNLSNWENGEHGLPKDMAMRIWDEFKISPDWIYLGLVGNLPDHLSLKLKRPKLIDAVATDGERRQKDRHHSA